MRIQCDHYATQGYRCPYTALKEYDGAMLCERHYWNAKRDQRTPDMCTYISSSRRKCRQTGIVDGLCEVHYAAELRHAKQLENFVAWLDKLFKGGELFYGRDAVLPEGVFACPLCGLAAYVVDSEIGKRCTFCGYSWPYAKERANVRGWSNTGSLGR
jgi:hypothetical protein